MAKVNAVGQINGFMTICDTDRLPMAIKQKVCEAPAGKERRFTKTLIDPAALPAELQALITKAVNELKAAKEAETDPKEKAKINTGEVVVNGRAYVGGYKKDGTTEEGRKHSLTSRVSFKVQNVLSLLSDAKSVPVSKTSDDELLAALTGMFG